MAASTVRYSNVRKNSIHKALRRADRSAIAEFFEVEPKLDPTPNPVPVEGWRLVIQTQVYENYGAHNWDGKGECPQYWKAKGGHEYQTPAVYTIYDSGNAEIEREIINRYRHMIEERNHGYHEYIISVDWYPTTQETPDEVMYREMKEWGYRDSRPHWRMLTPEAEMDEAWGMYHACLSVEGHNRSLKWRCQPEEEVAA